MFGKLSKLLGGRHEKKRPQRSGTIRTRKSRRLVPEMEMLEARDLLSTVIFGATTQIVGINNEVLTLQVNADGSTTIFTGGKNRGTDTSHKISLTESGGVNALSIDDTAGYGDASITTDTAGRQAVAIGGSSGANLYTLTNDLFATKTLDAPSQRPIRCLWAT